ncbi:hypothetical protein [Polyangium aurulentum]|uniref:hypothetical protein n=1 Tax=Polyangium aurulentum TaxID=2567896 RepID=UPI0010AE6C9D|nr:hypothetical protein [Polyangium aurulentum]UQA54640.1 hypothetical protein E8A73_025030 [Polyangium aurulentum]
MGRKLSLPLFSPGSALPTVDSLRKRLGGRAMSEPGAGDGVTVVTESGLRTTGVVLFVRGDELEIWVDHNLVRSTQRSSTAPLDAPLPRDLAAVAADARAFASLVEGQRINYLEEERIGEGVILEKCRFGAVVERKDGKLVGLGFRRLWPAEEPLAALARTGN